MSMRPIALAVVAAITFALVLAGCEEMTPDDKSGTLSVSSEPQGARVFLDGEDTGKQTPATFSRVSPGSHTIRLTREGSSEWGPHRFTVTAGETTRVDATLSPVPDADPQALGLEPLPQDIYQKLPVLRAEPVATPGAIDLTPNFPVARSQGFQGSCVGWAVAYALKSYHERVERGWSLTDDAHLMSPAYVYNQAKLPGGGSSGTYIMNALNLLVDQGVSSLASMPYDYRDYQTQPNAAARAEATNYRIATWGRVDDSGTRAEFEQEMKRHLAAERPIVIAIPVYPDFRLDESNPIYDNSSGMSRGGHAIVVVGYDDSRHAFRILNSWGRHWGIDGYGWIHYDFIDTLIDEAYVTVDETGHATVVYPTQATQPVPRDASTGVAPDTKLAWTRGEHTTSFDVYVGTSPQLGSLEFRGNTDAAEFQASLASDTRYFWRIDSRSDTGITRGPVWSFTTAADDDRPGTIWKAATSPVSDIHYVDIAWSGTRFVAVGVNVRDRDDSIDYYAIIYSAIIYSDDGITWREANLPDLDVSAVAWAGGRFFVLGLDSIASSTDGVTWTTAISGGGEDVAWNGERFVATPSLFGTFHSNDGITWTWTEAATDRDFGWNYGFGSEISWNGQRFVSIGSSGTTGIIMYSSDGITWSEAHSKSSHHFRGLAWNGERFVAGGFGYGDLDGSSVIMYSSNGITWNEAVTDLSFSEIIWNGERFVGAAFEDDYYTLQFNSNSTIQYSSDGIDWTADRTTNSFIFRIAGSPSRLVAVGANGTIVYSQ